MSDYHESVDWLKAEVARLKQLLEWSQHEVHEFISEKAVLLTELEETKSELKIVKRTYDGLLDEGEAAMAELADLKSK